MAKRETPKWTREDQKLYLKEVKELLQLINRERRRPRLKVDPDDDEPPLQRLKP